jgi:hypothetical protein
MECADGEEKVTTRASMVAREGASADQYPSRSHGTSAAVEETAGTVLVLNGVEEEEETVEGALVSAGVVEEGGTVARAGGAVSVRAGSKFEEAKAVRLASETASETAGEALVVASEAAGVDSAAGRGLGVRGRVAGGMAWY